MKHFLLAGFAALSIAATAFIPASAMEPLAVKQFTIGYGTVAAWNQGNDPQAMNGAQLVTATDYLTITVRDAQPGSKLAYQAIVTDNSTGKSYFYNRYDVAGQTNGIRLPYRSSNWIVYVGLISPNTTQTATHVTASVCAFAATACPLPAPIGPHNVKW